MASPDLSPRERLIVALDVSTAADARRLVSQLGGTVSTFKVGKQLFTATGPDMVRELTRAGHGVFLDLKFHDIPHTVEMAVREAAALHVKMLTVHASGGSRMLRAALRAASAAATPPLVLGVTVLTSMNDADVAEVFDHPLTDQVLRLADLALSCGCGGIVTSAREAQSLRRELGTGFAIVTPGIRPMGADVGDQARIVTPADAMRAGVSHIVVGRPITGAPKPAEAAQAILEELASVL